MALAVVEGKGKLLGHLGAVIALLAEGADAVGKGETFVIAEHQIRRIETHIGIPDAGAGERAVFGEFAAVHTVGFVVFVVVKRAVILIDDGIRGVDFRKGPERRTDFHAIHRPRFGEVLRKTVQPLPLAGNVDIKRLLLLFCGCQNIGDRLLHNVAAQGRYVVVPANQDQSQTDAYQRDCLQASAPVYLT